MKQFLRIVATVSIMLLQLKPVNGDSRIKKGISDNWHSLVETISFLKGLSVQGRDSHFKTYMGMCCPNGEGGEM